MKIVSGLGCIDDYIRLVKAGADEVFCGYVPYEWNKKYGSLFPLNRREVLYYNIQINSLEDMKILKKMVDIYKVPVSIAFNYLYYIEEQYEEIANIIEDLIRVGFNEFIIADIALILYLKEKGIKCVIHLSGECAEINSLSIDFLNKLNPDVEKRLELYYKDFEDEELYLENEDKNDSYLLGSTGCGICELKKLKESGVTHLKVVGRGKYIDDIEKDIIGLKQAINIIGNIEDDENYKKAIKNKLFKGKCSKECYY